MTLKQRLGRSTVWMSAAASGNSVVSFLIFIVLSRILAPAEIGLVAFALIVVEAGKIIVIGTEGTIAGGAYERAIATLPPETTR